MKKLGLFLALLVSLSLILAACGPAPAAEPESEQPTEAPETGEATEPPAAEPFRVAVVMPSAINDLAFSQSIYDALTAVQNEMGAENFEFAYSENMFVVDDAAAAIRDWLPAEQ